MRITPNTFSEVAVKTADEELRAGVWELWPEYVIKTGRRAGRYIEAQEPDQGPLPVDEEGRVVPDPDVPEGILVRRARIRNERWTYQPLVRYPDLFLTFARLAGEGGLDEELDTEKNAEIAREWVMDYGTLGLTPVKRKGRVGISTRGGTGDTVTSFASEAWTANTTVDLYKAATASGGPAVETIAPFIPSRRRAFFTNTPARARQWALEQVANTVQERVAQYAYPALYQQPRGNFVWGWDFANLLGAMWLQMFWFLTSDNQRRCRHCNSPLLSSRPNKMFCSRTCRNLYDYREYEKPRRQAARAHRL